MDRLSRPALACALALVAIACDDDPLPSPPQWSGNGQRVMDAGPLVPGTPSDAGRGSGTAGNGTAGNGTAGQGDAASSDAGFGPDDGCGVVGAQCCSRGVACGAGLECIDGACSDCGTAVAPSRRCGTLCSVGSHPVALQCDSNCGNSCITSNSVVCAVDCGATLVTCNTFCPAGYRATRSFCDTDCGPSCITTNAVECARTNRGAGDGTSFRVCDTRCPGGSHIISVQCDAACGTSCITPNSVTCAPDQRP